jgi:AcrR family transcriptional regulator
MGRPADKAPFRRLEIMQSFYEVLVKHGLQDASMAKIAKRMGVQPSLLIHYYATKEEMIDGLVDFITKKYEETFFPKLDGTHDPAHRLNLILDMVFGLEWFRLVDNSALYACYYLSFQNQKVKHHFQEMYLRLRDVLIEEIRGCGGNGHLSKDDAEKTADLVLILLGGFNYQKNLFDDAPRFEALGRRLKALALSLIDEARMAP